MDAPSRHAHHDQDRTFHAAGAAAEPAEEDLPAAPRHHLRDFTVYHHEPLTPASEAEPLPF